jgi:hypothetical protein
MIVSVVAVSVVAYWPSIDNSFISDDFTMLPFVRMVSAHPGQLLEMPSEIFRLVSYVYFWICLKTFGPNPEFFYWTGIALHALASLLVGRLVFVLARNAGAAWVAALFFAAYERHQEAVMWISAVNDTLLTLFSLIFLLFWERSLSNPRRGWSYGLSLGALFIALFSKDSSAVLVPLATLMLILRRCPRHEIVERTMPLFVMLAGYVTLWLWVANRNFFLVDGHYDLSLHFFPVYARALWRLFSPVLLFLVPLVWLAYRRSRLEETARLLRSTSVLFFVATIVITVMPYSFLTYLDHIPSRNTYLPSVGLAALAGVIFSSLYGRSATRQGRLVCGAFLCAVLSANVAYIWVRKEPQFLERAAPTRELIASLNGPEFQDVGNAFIYVCSFPLHVSIGRSAVEEFTRFGPGRVAFLDHCDESRAVNALDWTEDGSTYEKRIAAIEAASGN